MVGRLATHKYRRERDLVCSDPPSTVAIEVEATNGSTQETQDDEKGADDNERDPRAHRKTERAHALPRHSCNRADGVAIHNANILVAEGRRPARALLLDAALGEGNRRSCNRRVERIVAALSADGANKAGSTCTVAHVSRLARASGRADRGHRRCGGIKGAGGARNRADGIGIRTRRARQARGRIRRDGIRACGAGLAAVIELIEAVTGRADRFVECLESA
eukprot:scaffold15277_cov129-Isochrysis_galbana.AAC.3